MLAGGSGWLIIAWLVVGGDQEKCANCAAKRFKECVIAGRHDGTGVVKQDGARVEILYEVRHLLWTSFSPHVFGCC